MAPGHSKSNNYSMKKGYWDSFGFIVLFIVGLNHFLFVRYAYAHESLVELEAMQLLWPEFVIIINLSAILGGMLSSLTEKYIFPPLQYQKNIFLNTILRSLVYSLEVLLVVVILTSLLHPYLENEINLSEQLWFIITSDLFKVVLIEVIGVSILISILMRLRLKIGRHYFFNYLFNKFRKPVEERRVFLFLDMNESTYLAEKLGHKNMSRLLRNVFNELSSIARLYEAEIYQYVGDEVIFSWSEKSAFRNDNLIWLYERINGQIEMNKLNYLKEYGAIPRFKASAHFGFVIKSEIGIGRSEIVYHGDVLNTCSRILEKCKDFKKEFLISDMVFKRIENKSRFKSEGNYKLRGKSNRIGIYSLCKG